MARICVTLSRRFWWRWARNNCFGIPTSPAPPHALSHPAPSSVAKTLECVTHCFETTRLQASHGLGVNSRLYFSSRRLPRVGLPPQFPHVFHCAVRCALDAADGLLYVFRLYTRARFHFVSRLEMYESRASLRWISYGCYFITATSRKSTQLKWSKYSEMYASQTMRESFTRVAFWFLSELNFIILCLDSVVFA